MKVEPAAAPLHAQNVRRLENIPANLPMETISNSAVKMNCYELCLLVMNVAGEIQWRKVAENSQ